MEYTKQQKFEAYKKLPQAIKDVVNTLDENLSETLKKIATKNNLHIDQLGSLADEVGLVMFGLSSTSQFNQEIQNKLHLTSTQASAITTDINQEIFLKIREAVQKASQDQENTEPSIKPIEDAQPKRSQILSEMENPPKIPPAPEIIEQKVSQIFNLPSEKADVTVEAKLTEANKPWLNDPYLERP